MILFCLWNKDARQAAPINQYPVTMLRLQARSSAPHPRSNLASGLSPVRGLTVAATGLSDSRNKNRRAGEDPRHTLQKETAFTSYSSQLVS